MQSKDWARAAVAEPGWFQLEGKETDFIDLDALRTHVTAAIDAALADQRDLILQLCAKRRHEADSAARSAEADYIGKLIRKHFA